MGRYRSKLNSLTKEDLSQILEGCSLQSYPGSRDYTMIQTVVNTGISRPDLALLRLDDVTSDYLILRRGVHVSLVGKRVRDVLGTYLESRKGIPADHDFLFVHGQTLAALTDRQIGHIIAARCRQARADVPHPYDALRFYFVQRWLKLGGNIEDLKLVFQDKRGRRRLLQMASPPQGPSATHQDRKRIVLQLKDRVVEWYLKQGLSFKAIYREYGVTERTARACLKAAGFQARNVSQAAQMRYTKSPDSSPVGKRLQEMGMRAWQQEERYGTALLKFLTDRRTVTLPEIYAEGFSRRQYEHARDWLVRNGYAMYSRSTNVGLEITDSGLSYCSSITSLH